MGLESRYLDNGPSVFIMASLFIGGRQDFKQNMPSPILRSSYCSCTCALVPCLSATSVSHAGRSGNPNLACSNPDIACSNPDPAGSIPSRLQNSYLSLPSLAQGIGQGQQTKKCSRNSRKCVCGSGRNGLTMGLDQSMLIHKWHCDASRVSEVTYRRCLQYNALFEVIIVDLLND